MEILKIESSKHKPGVLMDPERDLINIYGYSLPEDAIGFYQPIINWILQYEAICGKKTKTQSSLQVSFKIIYFNSASNRAFLNIFQHLKRINEKGLDIHIDWYYEIDDKVMFESGKDLAEISGIQVNFIECE